MANLDYSLDLRDFRFKIDDPQKDNLIAIQEALRTVELLLQDIDKRLKALE